MAGLAARTHAGRATAVRILVLSFYFRPDLSAGSFRATALVEAFGTMGGSSPHVDVITTAPNRYSSFVAEAPPVEDIPGVSVRRIPMPAHKSGMADQSKAFTAFARGALEAIRGKEYDLVFATSSRLMTAALGAAIARRKRAALYLDIRDIFADNLRHIAPSGTAWVMQPAFSLLERWVITQADKVNLVSPGFAPYFTSRYPEQRFSYYTNGIDGEFLRAAPTRPGAISAATAGRPLTVLYAGNVGEGQGLHCIVPALAKQMAPRIRFRIIGDGGRKGELARALAAAGVTTVELLPPVGREELLHEYRAADVLFLHLNDYEAFRAVLPSKIFEYAALGKPIWAGVSGYSAEFLRGEVVNAAVFRPCDVEEAATTFDRIIVQDAPRPGFLAKYDRAVITRKLADDVVSVVHERK